MEQPIKFFNQKELKQLFKAIEQSDSKHRKRDLAIFRVAYCCGLRASEIGLITLDNYNKSTGELYCKRLKGSWNNTIRLDKETIKVLNKYIRENTFNSDEDILFKSQEGKPISRKTLDVLMKKYSATANIKNTSLHHFHALKHSCGVHLAESGLDVKELNFWLAHKNINNTMIYFQFTTTQQQQLYKKLETNNKMV